ncbi:MAG: hypothetical protein ACE5FU_00360, partial [Nitrospinota bacterium]
GKNGVETKKSTPKTSRTKKALLKFHSLAPTHVELNEAIVDRHSKQSEEALQLIDTRITATPLNTQVQTLRNVDSGGTTFLDRVIFFFTEAPGYVRDNPLESLIYLMLLYFFFKIAAMIFLGK